MEKPYLTKIKVIKQTTRKWNSKYDQDAICECGHFYYRHFDSYDNMFPCGCKYCGCYIFKKIESENIPDYGKHMTMNEWLKGVRNCSFLDHDGYGKYATNTKMVNKKVYPSDVKEGRINKAFSHIVWFNK